MVLKHMSRIPSICDELYSLYVRVEMLRACHGMFNGHDLWVRFVVLIYATHQTLPISHHIKVQNI